MPRSAAGAQGVFTLQHLALRMSESQAPNALFLVNTPGVYAGIHVHGASAEPGGWHGKNEGEGVPGDGTE